MSGKMLALAKFRENSIFVNGLSWITGSSELKQYFEKFGKVTNTYIFMDRYRGISKGHALVKFEDNEAIEEVLKPQQHVIDSQEIVVKRDGA